MKKAQQLEEFSVLFLVAVRIMMGAGESASGPVNWASFQTDIPIDKPVVLQQMQPGSLPVKVRISAYFLRHCFYCR